MNEQPIGDLAKKLEQELSQTKTLSEEDRKLLEELGNDIRKLSTHHQDVLARLRDATARFEVSHPSLTAVTAQVIDSLNKMGV